MLSEVDQRRYVCLMCMQSAGRLKRATLENICFELRITEDEASATIERLKKAKLLDKDGCVHNWDERQPKRDHSADRTAKYRAKKKLADVAETSQQRCSDADVTRCDGHSDALDQIKEKKDKDQTAKPRKRVDGVVEIVEHLNRVTGRKYGTDRGNTEIERALKDGATVEDCCKVIDHLWEDWGNNPKMVKHVDKTTPFRKGNFDRYLDSAQAGRPRTGGSASGYIEY